VGKFYKRIMALLLMLVLLVGLVPVGVVTITASAEENGGGYGSNGKFLAPIEPPVAGSIPISNRAEIEAIAGNLSGEFHLTADIDLAGSEWLPIGGNANPFTGTFDGQGFVIKNLTIADNSYKYNGLFGYVSINSRIVNVGLEETNITVSYSEQVYIGALIGYAARLSQLSNCYNSGRILCTNYFSSFAGGLVGSHNDYGDIEYCYNAGDVSLRTYSEAYSDASSYVGGIVGYSTDAAILRSYNDGVVSSYVYGDSSASSRAYSYTGGISGSSAGTIIACYNKGNVSSRVVANGSSYSYVGGITGNLREGSRRSFRACYNVGDILSGSLSNSNSSYSSANVGGIVGYANLMYSRSIEDCYSGGNISGNSNHAIKGENASCRAGGIVGYASGAVSVKYCITLSENISGNEDGTFTSIIGNIGENGGKNNNYAIASVYGNVLDDADWRITINEARTQATYEELGWDFDTVWKMPTNSGYPILQWQQDEKNLKIIRFDWLEPSQMTDKGSATQNGILTYAFDTYVYAHKIHLTVTDGAEWALYKDPECTKAVDKDAAQTYVQLNTPYLLYIKLTKAGFDDAIYGLKITRKAILSQVSIEYESPYASDGVDTATVNWGVSLFNGSSMIYNHDLALVAAALSAAADTENGDASKLYGVNGAYQALEFSGARVKYYNYDAVYATTISGSTTGDHCFSIASQDMTIEGKQQTVIAVVMRGTKSNNENLGYLDNKPEKNFHGYDAWKQIFNYAKKVEQQFWKYIGDYNLWEENIKVLITGHSLGGGAANLFASSFELDDQNIIDTNDIYAFTFGALNSITSTVQDKKFDYVNNVFNFYDTYGPFGEGTAGVRPSYGEKTMTYKFGHILEFIEDYREVFDTENKYVNHNMPAYVDALRRNLESVGADSTRILVLCPVDVEIYNNSNQLVARIVNNIIDTSVTTVPAFVEGDEKYVSLPMIGKYVIRLTAFGTGVMSYIVETANSSTDEPSQIKLFTNVVLTNNKQMRSEVGGNTEIPETRLYVLDESGKKTMEILTNGEEEIIKIIYGKLTEGDVVNISDLIKLAQHLAGIVELTADELEAANVTHSGDVDILDLIKLAQYLAGIVESLDY